MLASGISSFNVRVALGKFRAWFGTKHEDYDHVWVMYKDESGKWQVVEPVAQIADSGKAVKARKMPDTAEYIPYYIFNDVHLWTMQAPSLYTGKHAIQLKQNWSSLHPKFAGWVHKTVLNEALTPDICPDWVLKALNQHFTSVLWKRSLTVDDVDLPGNYDPRDHFDNGYIEEGWQQVAGRLSQFNTNSIQNLDMFHLAAHAIGDFYAHSSYGQFGAQVNGALALYNPADPASTLPQPPDYGAASAFNIATGQFTTNAALWQGNTQAAAALWQGKVISGRYAQTSDSHGIAESITYIPATLTRDKRFALRGALPHHNEIAVDEDSGSNVLYTQDKFAAQFKLRKDAAVRHIRQAFIENWKP